VLEANLITQPTEVLLYQQLLSFFKISGIFYHIKFLKINKSLDNFEILLKERAKPNFLFIGK